MLTASEYQGALREMSALYRRANEMMYEARRSEAIWAGMLLLQMYETYPSLIGFSYEENWEYDDEGGYHHSASIYPEMNDTVAEHQETIDEHGDPREDDFLYGVSPEACRSLFAYTQGCVVKEQIENRLKELRAGAEVAYG